jgi:hypothetical protein
MRLLRAMCPLPENGLADLSAVIQTAEKSLIRYAIKQRVQVSG